MQSTGYTIKQYSDDKKLPIAFLKSIGLRHATLNKKTVVAIPYYDKEKNIIALRYRHALKGKKRFTWKPDTTVALYGMDRLGNDPQTKYIIICEGESDVQSLWHRGFDALGLPGAACWNDARDAELLNYFEKIYVVIEDDAGGWALRKTLHESSMVKKILLVSLDNIGGVKYKDMSAMYMADAGLFDDRLFMALEQATPAVDFQPKVVVIPFKDLTPPAQSIANNPNILDLFVKDLRLRKVVGEDGPLKLIYLAITSRLLAEPVSLAIKGPSAGGKSYITASTLDFFPANAYYALTSMSERALAYSTEPLVHRMLVIYEFSGLSNEFSSYLVRSLLSEGRIAYETVERTKQGMVTKLITREGPTGLLTTTTKVKIHPENETRLLSINVVDTPEQTQKIMLEQAKPTKRDPKMLLRWHEYQEWLRSGPANIIVPYAYALAKCIPPVAVRLRRDFRLLLALIKSHALMHKHNRETNAYGDIIAVIEDYAVVNELVSDILSEVLESTVSHVVRATVDTVQALLSDGVENVTITAIARKLSIDNSAAFRRVKGATMRGFLVNLESKPYRAARIVMGDSMPHNQTVLPTPDEVCRFDAELEGSG
ncbi:MAG: hypothetical protein IIA59_03270 [Candidatus Marinimicrobia bacterium]|nr:hypothetical protein [Candidatus Neomarinimicrobiota bacterium]